MRPQQGRDTPVVGSGGKRHRRTERALAVQSYDPKPVFIFVPRLVQ